MISRRDSLAALASLPMAGLASGVSAPATAATQAGAAARPRTHPELRIGTRQKLVMIGDSITDAGRARPIGEGRTEEIGRGYVMMVEAWLNALYPERFIRVVNMGISGNTTRDLKARWQTDVLDLQPDWVSIMIGANDVWRQFDSPKLTEKHVPLAEYEANLTELVAATKPLVKGLVLLTPFYLEAQRQDAMRATMDRYGDVVRKVAAREQVPLGDTQAALDRLLEVVYSATINWDRVHLNPTGAVVVARTFLDAVGFDWLR